MRLYTSRSVCHLTMQNIEPNPTEELLKYHTLYQLLKNIKKERSAVCLGKIAHESGLVEDEVRKEEKEKDYSRILPIYQHYDLMRLAVKKASKSASFAFDLGDSGLSEFTLQIWTADGLVDCGGLGYIKMDVLKKHCTPAPFGDLTTMTTKVDPEVRSAWTIDYDKIVIKKFSSKKKSQKEEENMPQEDHYKKAVQDLLLRVQDAFQDDQLYFEPYKLNVYDQGGFFKPHVDTPRYSNMVGTMVVRLEDAYGGDLIVRHGNESFKAKSETTAFFCDREHEVTPVKYGTRVTLTFNICKDSETVAKTERAITLTRATALVKENNVASLISAIKESPFKKIGILTEFDYTQKGITLQTLKGTDRVLLEELSKESSFKIDLLPTVVSQSYSDNENHDEYPIRYYLSGKVYRILPEDLDRMMKHEKAKKIPREDRAVFFCVKDGLEVYQHEQKGAMHVGNEALDHSIDNVYFNAAIIVTDLNPKSTQVKDPSKSSSDEAMDD